MILVVNNCVNAECKLENGNNTELLKAGSMLYSGFVANSRYKIQVLFKDFQRPKLHFQAPKSSTKSHILEVDIQKLDCNLNI